VSLFFPLFFPDYDRLRWDEFKRRYFKELEDKEEVVKSTVARASGSTVTLLYGAKDRNCNNAVALKEFIEQRT
jgi:uncharacterized protein YeaO (DUF488 family)